MSHICDAYGRASKKNAQAMYEAHSMKNAIQLHAD